LVKHTRPYVALVEGFVRSHGIRNVVDLGCGDWQFSRHIDWHGAEYRGYDLAATVIARNRELFAKPNVQFFEADESSRLDLPPGDLLIVKDVLQHWSNRRVHEFLPELPKFRYCLLTNCINPRGETTNRDIEDGDFRYLDLRKPPFNMTAEVMLQFENYRPALLSPIIRPRWRKHVLLVRPGGSSA
jgi:SAM-dependent methyltransferase